MADTERKTANAGDVSCVHRERCQQSRPPALRSVAAASLAPRRRRRLSTPTWPRKCRAPCFPSRPIYNPTGEFRLSSPGKGFLDWTVGGFWSDRTTHANNSEVLGDPVTGVILPQPANNVYTRLIFDHLKQVAGFGEATAHLTDALALTFGARYFDYTRDVGGATPLGLDLVGAAVTPYRQVSSSETAGSPRPTCRTSSATI